MRGKIFGMKRKAGVAILLLTVFVSLLFLGCGGAEEPADEPVETIAVEEPEVEVPTDTLEPTETPSPTAIPTSTPIPPLLAIDASDTIFLTEELLIDSVALPEDGWLVIWPDNGTELDPDDALAYVKIDAGVQDGVSIPLEAKDWQFGSVQVAVHTGRGDSEDFAADGSNIAVVKTIKIETEATQPMIQTQSLIVSDAGFLTVDKVRALEPSWLAVYDRSKETLLGFRLVPAGESENVEVPIQWYNSSSTVHLFMLTDMGNADEFEDGIDQIVTVNDQPLSLEIEIGLPAEIVIIDQPKAETILVERITSPIDGYVAVFGDQDEDGFPNTIIGSAPIQRGVNEYVEIEIDDTAVTPQMILSLFTDSDGDGAFDYFEDEPIFYAPQGNDLAQLFVPIRTDIEGMLLVDHQSTAEMILVDWAVAYLDGWIVVEKLPAAQPAESVGQIKIEAGLHNNLEIPISGVRSGDEVRVMLYINNPDEDLFEPERNDFPLLAEGRLVFVEFEVK